MYRRAAAEALAVKLLNRILENIAGLRREEGLQVWETVRITSLTP